MAAIDREGLFALARSLDLPNVVETTAWGEPCLKAHGKMWAWWSPSEHCPVFKVSFEERDMLLQLRSEVFFLTDHYCGHRLVLMRPDRFDEEWARDRLLRMWREMAPKRFLKAYAAGAETP